MNVPLFLPDSEAKRLIDQFVERSFAVHKWWRRDKLVGCTDSEIAEVEDVLGFTLPKVFREFMRRMGKASGYSGLCTYSYLSDRERIAEFREAIQDSIASPAADLAILQQQDGYIWIYVRSGEGDDPPVYELMDGENEIRRADRLSDYLLSGVDKFE